MIRIVSFHVLPENLPPYVEALQASGLECTADWYVSPGSQFSAGYDTTTGIASQYHTLRSFLEARTQWEPGDTLVLVAWSAGCWAVQAWLRQAIGTEDFDLADAVLLLDGAHLVDPRVEGLVAYARSAMAGRHLLASTNSDITIPGGRYPSTSQAAVWLLDELGITDPEGRERPEAGQVGRLHVIDTGAQDAAAHIEHVRELGPRLMGELVAPWLVKRANADLSENCIPTSESYTRSETVHPSDPPPPSGADTVPAYDLGTLGERAAAYCEAQMRMANPPTPPMIAAWLRLSVRQGGPIWTADTPDQALAGLNFCAAAQSAALLAVANADDELPHMARAGVVELVSDALERSRWHEVSEVRAGVWAPQVGDLAIYDRSVPGRSETSWWRHVDRVLDSLSSTGCRTIGANEGQDMWRVESLEWSNPKLLGFISYSEDPPIHLLDAAEVRRQQAMALALTLDELMVRHWERVA